MTTSIMLTLTVPVILAAVLASWVALSAAFVAGAAWQVACGRDRGQATSGNIAGRVVESRRDER